MIDFDAVGAATLSALPETLPVVAASGAPKNVEARPHAYLDDFEGSRLDTQHLLDLGHKTVHHVAIPATRERSGREWGWRRTLEVAGAYVPDVVRAKYDPASGLAVVDVSMLVLQPFSAATMNSPSAYCGVSLRRA
ncbi:hypothetical protein [Clavibacter michiganensis]|uniref:hypothetical protein n=1 Tax=Clavibacter michiganensis TaxID=28447 RepID=UPI001FB4EBF8|nr:hypothetical protein [Clavibacter michiganensis]